ncbi:MAG: HEAT repeat domain-containing protein [Bradymonadia bacterium]
MRRIGIITAAAGISVALWAGFGGESEQAASQPEQTAKHNTITRQASLGDGPQLAWQLGRRYRYQLTYTAEQTVTRTVGVGETVDIAGQADLEGIWIIEPIAQAADHWRLKVRLADVTRHRLMVLDTDAIPSAEAAAAVFDGAYAELTVGLDGRVRAIDMPQDSHRLFKHIAQMMASELELVVQAEGAWSAEQYTQYGAMVGDYTATEVGAQWQVERRREQCERLQALPEGGAPVDGRTLAHVSPAGHVVDLQSTMHIEVSEPGHGLSAHHSLSLVLVDITEAEVVAQQKTELERRVPGQIKVSADAERQMLTRRAAGLTFDQISDDLMRFGPAGEMPDHQRWLWRATGLLRLQPELCEQLVTLFEEPALGQKGRALVADLLANAGHPQAQNALRTALETPAARADDERGLLIQRFSMVESTTAASLDWLEEELTSDAAGAAPMAAAFALGSAIDHHSDEGRSVQAYQRLASGLDGIEDTEARGDMIRALGNTARSELVQLLEGDAQHPEVGVRAATATALRAVADPGAGALLLDLALDADYGVQGSALDALDEQARAGRLTPEMQTALAEMVLEGDVHSVNHSRVKGLIGRYGVQGEAAQAALAWLSDQQAGQ